jgi:glyoxylase-like metal-dependent hydrolase (beta-lactamase superfamily II)
MSLFLCADADHLTAAAYLRDRLKCKVAIGAGIVHVQRTFGAIFNLPEDKDKDHKQQPQQLARDGSQFDELLRDGQEWTLGNVRCRVMAPPGHTPACVSLVVGDAVFCGDTLFMPDIGTARCGTAVIIRLRLPRLSLHPIARQLRAVSCCCSCWLAAWQGEMSRSAPAST